MEVNLKLGLNLPDKEDDLTCLAGLRTAWILRGQWGSRLPGEAQPRREVFAKDRAESAMRTKTRRQASAWCTSTWLKFLCRGKQSLILKRFLIPNLLG